MNYNIYTCAFPIVKSLQKGLLIKNKSHHLTVRFLNDHFSYSGIFDA